MTWDGEGARFVFKGHGPMVAYPVTYPALASRRLYESQIRSSIKSGWI
jgi:hypothetical protein